MNILQHMIGLMNKEEVRHFKLFANRTNASTGRKDLLLFDHIRNTYPEYDETKIQKKLYGSADKNTLYRLKNRLLEDVGKSIALQYFESTEFNLILNQIALARLFQGKKPARNSPSFSYAGREKGL